MDQIISNSFQVFDWGDGMMGWWEYPWMGAMMVIGMIILGVIIVVIIYLVLRHRKSLLGAGLETKLLGIFDNEERVPPKSDNRLENIVGTPGSVPKFCPTCGSERAPGAKYCTKCGAPFS